MQHCERRAVLCHVRPHCLWTHAGVIFLTFFINPATHPPTSVPTQPSFTHHPPVLSPPMTLQEIAEANNLKSQNKQNRSKRRNEQYEKSMRRAGKEPTPQTDRIISHPQIDRPDSCQPDSWVERGEQVRVVSCFTWARRFPHGMRQFPHGADPVKQTWQRPA